MRAFSEHDVSKKNINFAFIVGSDVTSYLIAQRAVRDLLQLGFTGLLLFPEHPTKKRAPAEISELQRHERSLLWDCVLSFLESKNQTRSLYSLSSLRQFSSTSSYSVKDVNEPSIVSSLIDSKSL